MILICDNYAAPWVAYSIYAVGGMACYGPKKRDIDKLEQYLENGSYIYGDLIPNLELCAHTQGQCRDPFEPQYYCGRTNRGGRVTMAGVCYICYAKN